jgi:hypothetical protein
MYDGNSNGVGGRQSEDASVDTCVDVAVTRLTLTLIFYVTAAASESEYDGSRSSWPGPLPTM